MDLLYSIGRRLTTSHAIAELTGIESRLRLYGDDLLDFWRTSIDLLRQWDIDETLIRLLDLASDKAFEECLPRIGITDTGLIELALKNRCVLITEDERTLASQAGAMGVDCRLVRNLVAPAS
ncbi:MAG TPA: hypothetical protein VME43_00005 [Bryobacteraceae bacterium]|nr:hypothetical protein [Bryobacteraceae bacterium]